MQQWFGYSDPGDGRSAARRAAPAVVRRTQRARGCNPGRQYHPQVATSDRGGQRVSRRRPHGGKCRPLKRISLLLCAAAAGYSGILSPLFWKRK